jgi:hypothetical protein
MKIVHLFDYMREFLYMDTAPLIHKSEWAEWLISWSVVQLDVCACSKSVVSFHRRFELCGDLPRIWTCCTI